MITFNVFNAVQDLVLYMLEADQFVRGSAIDMIDHPWVTVSQVTNDNDNCNENVVSLAQFSS